MKIAFERKAKKYLDQAHQPFKEKVKAILDEIVADPFRQTRLSGDLREYYKYKFTFQGVQYRIIYRIEGETIIIAAIGTRENFYKRL